MAPSGPAAPRTALPSTARARQPAGTGYREGDRPGRGAAGQERPGVISQFLRADQGEEPPDGVRVRRGADLQRVTPAADAASTR